MSLPSDVARCQGFGFKDASAPGGIDWREGCEDCMRRTSRPQDPRRVQVMNPPPIITFECEYRIDPKERE